jgi:catechol 2,3-dioxygenase-like lactoylglutathione lyase family enzyme
VRSLHVDERSAIDAITLARPPARATSRAQEELVMLGDANAIATVAVKDIEKAKKFYADTLGLQQVHGQDGEMLMFRSGKSLINVYKSRFAGTNQATAFTWSVGDEIEDVVRTLRDKGVKFEHYDLPHTKVQGDIHVDGDMKVAWFKDPEGNILGLANH